MNEAGDECDADEEDGTSNFAYGRPEIGVVVALVYKGETVAPFICSFVQLKLTNLNLSLTENAII